MKSRGKSVPYAELLIVMGVLLPVSACTWANPWQKPATAAKEGEGADGAASTAQKEMPKVNLSRNEQQIYDKYHSTPGVATGLNPESRAIESRLGYK